MVSGGSWADGCVYSTVVSDITDGDRVPASSISSTSSTDKSKTKKAVSNLHKISVGRIVDVEKCLLTILHFFGSAKDSCLSQSEYYFNSLSTTSTV